MHITTVRIDVAKSVFRLHKMDVREHMPFSPYPIAGVLSNLDDSIALILIGPSGRSTW